MSYVILFLFIAGLIQYVSGMLYAQHFLPDLSPEGTVKFDMGLKVAKLGLALLIISAVLGLIGLLL